jgi:uncharacterized protein (TIGR03437 family)
MKLVIFWVMLLLLVLPAWTQTPNIVDGGVLNGASFALGQQVAPGSLVSIFGNNLASLLALASSIPLSNSLGNVSVTFNGIPAPMMAAIPGSATSAAQLNVQVPYGVLAAGTASGPATVVVTVGDTSSPAQTVQIGPAAPGIFSTQYGVGVAIAVNNDGTLAAAANSVPGFTSHPAKIGDPFGLLILATGLGAVDPPAVDGHDSLDTLRWAQIPTVLVGGLPAKVLFAGASPQFPGVNQLNIVLPAGVAAGDAVPLQIQAGGITSTDKVTIAISQ